MRRAGPSAENSSRGHEPTDQGVQYLGGFRRHQVAGSGDFEQLGLADHFRFTGLVPPTRIPELLGALDMVVHTSQWEGLARVLPQGLIAGKPVISYDVGGAREVVIPNETGFLLPRDSVDELADAMLTLASDPDLRHRMGTEGRRRFTEQFRHQFMTERIREVYQRVLARQ